MTYSIQESTREEGVPEESSTCCRRKATVGIAIAVFGVLFAIAASHKKAISQVNLKVEILNSKIRILEQENQLLKSALVELETRFQGDSKLSIEGITPVNVEKNMFLPRLVDDDKEIRKKPKTKKVWVGNEIEDRVEILDKKHNSLPDYCYFTDENDLFYDYNVEVCENKRRKLEGKSYRDEEDNKVKPETIHNLDGIFKNEPIDQPYDDYVTETLKALEEEIIYIKNKRADHLIPEDKKRNQAEDTKTATENEQEKPENEEKSEVEKPKERSSKKKKLQRQKQVGSSEWVEKRSSGREEARKLHDKQQKEINWYLKRKNEREMHRLGSTGQEFEL